MRSSSARRAIPAARFGVTPNASGRRNDQLLRAAVASVDEGSVLSFRPETYQLRDGVPILRGNIEIRGAGMAATIFEYASSHDGYIGTGTAFTIGSEKPPTAPIYAVTLRRFTCRDLRREPLAEFGHNPSAVDALWVDEFLAEDLGFENVKGNACLTVLGYARDDLTPVSQRVTIQGCECRGTAAGGWIQGDGINVSGVSEVVLRQNRAWGGIRRHFLEGGSAIHVLTAVGNVADMGDMGQSCLASFTVVERGTITGNAFSGWSRNVSAIEINPDLRPGRPLLPVNRLTASFNTFESRHSGLAAIALNDGDLSDHHYVGNTFRCLLPFSISKVPRTKLEISGNDAYWTDHGRVFVTIAAREPTAPVVIGGNHLHGRGARVIDRSDWMHHRLVSGLDTNVIE